MNFFNEKFNVYFNIHFSVSIWKAAKQGAAFWFRLWPVKIYEWTTFLVQHDIETHQEKYDRKPRVNTRFFSIGSCECVCVYKQTTNLFDGTEQEKKTKRTTWEWREWKKKKKRQQNNKHISHQVTRVPHTRNIRHNLRKPICRCVSVYWDRGANLFVDSFLFVLLMPPSSLLMPLFEFSFWTFYEHIFIALFCINIYSEFCQRI